MGNIWVTNILHYLDENGAFAAKNGPARQIAEHTCAIVEAVTSRPADADRVTAVRCRRRPGRKPCTGAIIAGYAEGDATTIVWGCPVCGDEGRINGWQETHWDNRKVCSAGTNVPVAYEPHALLGRLCSLEGDLHTRRVDAPTDLWY